MVPPKPPCMRSCRPNIWPWEALPELEGSFKDLGRLMMEVRAAAHGAHIQDSCMQLLHGQPACQIRVRTGTAFLREVYRGWFALQVGLRLTEHCDRYVAHRSATAGPNTLQQILLRSPCPKVAYLSCLG